MRADDVVAASSLGQADVVQAAVVADGDDAGGVDAVAARIPLGVMVIRIYPNELFRPSSERRRLASRPRSVGSTPHRNVPAAAART
jgi:hypothetical protein